MANLLYVDPSTLTNLANALGALSGRAGKIVAGDAGQQATIAKAAAGLNDILDAMMPSTWTDCATRRSRLRTDYI